MRLFLFVLMILIYSCENGSNEDFISLNPGELYSLDLHISGDEEGAQIMQQPLHYERSIIVRDSTTNWSAVYYYVPERKYIGQDEVVIETCTGGEGVACNDRATIRLQFNIVN